MGKESQGMATTRSAKSADIEQPSNQLPLLYRGRRMTEILVTDQGRSRARFRIAVPSWSISRAKATAKREPQAACREEFKRLLDDHLEPIDLHEARIKRQRQAAIEKIRVGLYGFAETEEA